MKGEGKEKEERRRRVMWSDEVFFEGGVKE